MGAECPRRKEGIMTEVENKKRTIRCTDEEWEQILERAENAKMSASRFIVEKALEGEGCALTLTAEEQRKIRTGMKFLCLQKVEDLRKTHTEDEVLAMIALSEKEE